MLIKTARKQGMKEVVDWIEKNAVTLSDRWGNTIKGFWISMPADPHFNNEWESQLREWGIEPKHKENNNG